MGGTATADSVASTVPGTVQPGAVVIAVDASLDIDRLRGVQTTVQSLLPALQGTHTASLVVYDTVVQRVEPLTPIDAALGAIWAQGLARIEPAATSNLAIALERGLDALSLDALEAAGVPGAPDTALAEQSPVHLLVFGRASLQGESAEQSARFTQWTELLLLPRALERRVAVTLVTPDPPGPVSEMIERVGAVEILAMQTGSEFVDSLVQRLHEPASVPPSELASSQAAAPMQPETVQPSLTAPEIPVATAAAPGGGIPSNGPAETANTDGASAGAEESLAGAAVAGLDLANVEVASTQTAVIDTGASNLVSRLLAAALLTSLLGLSLGWLWVRRHRLDAEDDAPDPEHTGLSSTYLPLHATTGRSFGQPFMHRTDASASLSPTVVSGQSPPWADISRTEVSRPEASRAEVDALAEELEQLRLITEQRQRHQPS